MLEALIVTLREGIEAALVVGIIVAFLRKEGRERYLGSVWVGIGAAVVASVLGAFVLYRLTVNEEAFEGVLYITSAAIVGSLVIWMWRHSRQVATQVRGSLARILDRESSVAVASGLFLFTFLMVFREGIETVFFLSALSLSTSGLLSFLGAFLGIAAAVTFGVFFVRGSLKIDLGRFFKVTGIALLIFVVQLLINGYHELSEAGWVPANEKTMGVVGPLVRNEFFFVAAVVLFPLLLLLVPSSRGLEAVAGDGPAAERLRRAAIRRQRRARMVGATLGVMILMVLTLGFARSRPPQTLSPATVVHAEADGQIHLPAATFSDGKLHRFALDVGETTVRFIGIRLESGKIVTAFDACEICGARGYMQDGSAITCLHCHSAIYPPSIGRPGGCNPIPLASRREAGEVVIAAADIAAGAAPFRTGQSHAHHT